MLPFTCAFLLLFASIFSHPRFTSIIIYCFINQNKAFMIYMYMYICEIQTAKFALLWYCVCFMYMCPYSILEHIYAQGFSVGNYCMWTWGAFNAKNLNNAMICEKCFSFRSSIYMYMFKKKILVSISIIFKGFLFSFILHFVYYLCNSLLLLAILNLLVGGTWSRLLLYIHFGQRPQYRLFYTTSL